MQQTALLSSLYTAAQSRELDHIAITEFGIAGAELMGRAGLALFERLQQVWPSARRITVLCGGGGNGGDGYVLSRLALAAGIDVKLHRFGEPGSEGATTEARTRFLELSQERDALSVELEGTDLLVDALFGSGLDRPVSEALQQLFLTINRSGIPVLSADLPSGLNADTGQAMGAAIMATETVSFIALKQGLFTGQARDYRGTVQLADLDLPVAVYRQTAPAATLLDWPTLVAEHLPPLKRAIHKGDRGHLLVVGGAAGMQGAARIAGEAALRCGAGLVSLGTHPGHAAQISSAVPELMVHGLASGEALLPLLVQADAVVLGPGLGQSAWGLELLQKVLDSNQPKLLDADALNLLAREPMKRADWILTPHPGEAARLLATTTQQVEADRFAAAQEIVARYGGVCVLKGAGSLVVSDDGIAVCADGNPGMASGGMGDLLSGLIGSLLVQGLSPFDAAKTGTALHAKAGDFAAVDGERGMLASDLLPWVRELVNGGLDATL